MNKNQPSLSKTTIEPKQSQESEAYPDKKKTELVFRKMIKEIAGQK